MKQIWTIPLMLALALAFSPVEATILRVPTDYSTVQAAIDAALSTDTVLVGAGVYVECILIQNKSLHLMSEVGHHCTRLQGNGTSSVIRVIDCPDVFVAGFTITGGVGHASRGGGVYLQGRNNESFRIFDCIIERNSADFSGGAIAGHDLEGEYYGTVEVAYCILRRNTSWNGGATDYPLSSVQHCVIDSNLATNHAGGLILYGSYNHTDVYSNTFVANHTYGNGGAIALSNSANPTLHNNVFLNNSAGGDGGAIGGPQSCPPPAYSCFYGNTPNDLGVDFEFGTGSFVDDPELIVSPDRLRYEPAPTSPLIDTGDPALPFDPDGSIADIGARPYSHLGNVAWIELVSPGPPNWGYRLHCESGYVEKVAFRNFCPGTTPSLTEMAACNWTIETVSPDSIVFIAKVALTDHMGGDETFWLFHPYCSDYVTWMAGDSSGMIEGPLPVELTTFQAFAGDGQVALRWRTESELDNDHFLLYKRKAGEGIFRVLTQIPGHGTTTEPHDYDYVDRFVQNSIAYEYQISDVDITGRETIHEQIVSATPSRSIAPLDFALYSNYPNPFNPTTTIRYDMKENGLVSLRIFDLLGREVVTLVNGQISAGTHTVVWDATGLPSGVYLCRMEAERFVETRKMMLLK
jgi:predicted outer membrane repeat protein